MDLIIPMTLCRCLFCRRFCSISPRSPRLALSIFCALFALRTLSPGFAQSAWEFSSGKWVQSNLVFSQQAPDGLGLALSTGDRRHYSARVKLRVSLAQIGAAAGLVLQASDANNYDVLCLQRKKGGLYSVLKTVRNKRVTYLRNEMVGDESFVSTDLSTWQELHAEVDGSTIAGYLNGREVVSFTFEGQPPKWYAHPALWYPDLDHGRAGLYTENTSAEFQDFTLGPPAAAPIYTPSKPRLDYRGGVLPRQSYAQTFTAWDKWFAHAGEYTDYRDAPAKARRWPPYVLSSFVFSDDTLGTDIQYPGHNHPPIIDGFIKQFLFDGSRQYLEPARTLADWDIQHSIPHDWALADLTLSHFDFHKDLDSLEPLAESGFEPDKSAYQGLAYLELYGVTADQKYLEAAVRIATTLRKLQRPDGGFPFRVRPKSGKVIAPYTASVMWYVDFFEDLADFTGDESYRGVRDRAFRWLMENPVKTNDWEGFYGDIATGAKSYDQWTALDTALYLLDKRRENPDYLPKALALVKWVEEKLVVKDGYYPGVPAIWEQTSYPVILTMHTNRLAEVYARIWSATGNAKYKLLAEQIANTVTWQEMSDGKMRIGMWWHAQGTATSGIMFTDQFLRIMSEIPETAPQDEDHFLFSTSYVRDIQYSLRAIALRTWKPGEARFSLRHEPINVNDEHGSIPELRQIEPATTSGWVYDPAHHFLRVRHPAKDVKIILSGGLGSS